MSPSLFDYCVSRYPETLESINNEIDRWRRFCRMVHDPSITPKPIPVFCYSVQHGDPTGDVFEDVTWYVGWAEKLNGNYDLMFGVSRDDVGEVDLDKLINEMPFWLKRKCVERNVGRELEDAMAIASEDVEDKMVLYHVSLGIDRLPSLARKLGWPVDRVTSVLNRLWNNDTITWTPDPGEAESDEWCSGWVGLSGPLAF